MIGKIAFFKLVINADLLISALPIPFEGLVLRFRHYPKFFLLSHFIFYTVKNVNYKIRFYYQFLRVSFNAAIE
jgi:hypothetical protein